MNENKKESLQPKVTAIAEVRRSQGVSGIWLIPLIALLIGGWLAYKTYSEEGPLISITFSSADGLEATKTKVRYKDVIIGEVEEIKLSSELDDVIVMARMNKEAESYLKTKTRFWVVRARVAAGEISALGTLLSGAYIGIDPVTSGEPARKFVGLEKQPLVTANVPGKHYRLRAPILGSLDIGSPVFYRQIKVGEVVDYNLSESGESVDIKIFIHAPHNKHVSTSTKFWNASGINIKLDGNGIEVNTQSLVSVLQGGIAFETKPSLAEKTTAPEEYQFNLHPDQASAEEKSYNIKNYYVMHFDQSVRGLEPGAPVVFRGFPIGEVTDIRLIFDADKLEASIPVLVMIEPERMEILDQSAKISYQDAIERHANEMRDKLLNYGLRAQLRTGNMLTGQLFIELDLFEEKTPAKVTYENGYPVFPTTPSPLGQMTEELSKVLKRIKAIPFEDLSQNINETTVALKSTLKGLEGLAGNINENALPNLDKTLLSLQGTAEDLRASLGTDSELNYGAQQALAELTETIRAIRSVADQLDRNPRALIFGRGETEQ